MTNNQDIFDNVGKRMPYTAPENYMATLQNKITMRAAMQSSQRKLKMKRLAWTAAASVAAVVVVGALTLRKAPQPSDVNLLDRAAQVYAQIPETDQNLINDSYDNDIFLNLTTY